MLLPFLVVNRKTSECSSSISVPSPICRSLVKHRNIPNGEHMRALQQTTQTVHYIYFFCLWTFVREIKVLLFGFIERIILCTIVYR